MAVSGIGCCSHMEVNTEMVSPKKRTWKEIGFVENAAMLSLIQWYLLSSVVKSQWLIFITKLPKESQLTQRYTGDLWE